jgi:hypothetical protein
MSQAELSKKISGAIDHSMTLNIQEPTELKIWDTEDNSPPLNNEDSLETIINMENLIMVSMPSIHAMKLDTI